MVNKNETLDLIRSLETFREAIEQIEHDQPGTVLASVHASGQYTAIVDLR